MKATEVAIAVLVLTLVVGFLAVDVSRMLDCWDANGEYVRGVSLTGYVCLPGAGKRSK